MSLSEAMDAEKAWNAGSAAWHEFVRSGADYYRHLVHGPALMAACLPVEGECALDLGCGEGYFSRELARRGARVVGVDVSGAMLAYAKAQESELPLGIEFVHLDARRVAERWPAGRFGLVTGCMSLQDMNEQDDVLRAAAEVLRPGGRLVFSVPHPCTDTGFREWERDEHGNKLSLRIDRYFESGPSIMHWNMRRLIGHWRTPFWRRTLTEWTALLGQAGFVVRGLGEPRPSEEQVRDYPELSDCFRLPYFLIFDTVKP